MRAISGRYVLEREIARGAFGTVWVATDRHLDRPVALKLVRRTTMPSGECVSFEREASVAAQLRSPHIVQVYDAGIEDDEAFIVMELLEGESLETRLERHPRLPLPIVAAIICDIAKGLATIHRAGLVHCDIKPSNVFLVLDSGRELAKLLDFGIATRQPSILPSKERTERAPVGTPRFMSPEQFQGAIADTHADLWALAVLAYQMITGAEAFHGATLAELRERVSSCAFTPPSAICSELGDSVDEFFARAFSPSSGHRFRPVEEFATEFMRLQDKEQPPVLRLLFLDDEPDMELLIRQRFRQLKCDTRYELHFATDAQRALEQLRTRPDIDVVLTDLNMPGMDGLTFLSHVPAANPFARVVVVSAYSDMANIRAAMNQGSFDFLGKPLDFEDLYRTIEKCGRHVRALRRLLQSGEENDILKAMVGRGMADRIISSVRANDSVRNESFQAAIAFVDVYGFSKALASLRPEAIFEHLNDHFSLFLPELLARGGTVSRFVGDAVMAIFEGDNHLSRAIEACLAIRERLLTLTGSNLAETRRYGVTIGLDAGSVVAGSAGSLAMGRLEPSLVGEAISTAARLQVLAKNYEILVSPAVHARIAAEYHCEIDSARTVAQSFGAVPVVRVLARPASRLSGDELRTATVDLTPM